MSKGISCKCDAPRSERMKNWVIVDYKCNYSKFNGSKHTHSDYSALLCTSCGNIWRTKQDYVYEVSRITENQLMLWKLRQLSPTYQKFDIKR